MYKSDDTIYKDASYALNNSTSCSLNKNFGTACDHQNPIVTLGTTVLIITITI